MRGRCPWVRGWQGYLRYSELSVAWSRVTVASFVSPLVLVVLKVLVGVGLAPVLVELVVSLKTRKTAGLVC